MATQGIVPSSQRLPLRRGKPSPTLLTTPPQAEKLLQKVNEISDQIKPDGRSLNKKRPWFKAPWLEQYRQSWKPGESGNKLGARPFKRMAAAYRDIAEEVEPSTGLTYGHLVALSQFKNAIVDGSVLSAKEIREAMEGKLLSDASPGELVEASLESIQQKLMGKLVRETETTKVTVEKEVKRETLTVDEREATVKERPFIPMRKVTSSQVLDATGETR